MWSIVHSDDYNNIQNDEISEAELVELKIIYFLNDSEDESGDGCFYTVGRQLRKEVTLIPSIYSIHSVKNRMLICSCHLWFQY